MSLAPRITPRRTCPACATHTEHTTYDVNEGFFDHPAAFTTAYIAWLEAHGIDKNITYRTEHHVIDAPLVRVYQCARDQNGRLYIDETTGDIALRKPFDVLITTPPPTPEERA